MSRLFGFSFGLRCLLVLFGWMLEDLFYWSVKLSFDWRELLENYRVLYLEVTSLGIVVSPLERLFALLFLESLALNISPCLAPLEGTSF